MKTSELEGRLRRAAATYAKAVPAIPNLERHILSRTANIQRLDQRAVGRGLTRRPSWQLQLIATAAVLAFALAVGFLIREAKFLQDTVHKGPRSSAPLVITSQCLNPITRFLSAQVGWGFSSRVDGWVVTGTGLFTTQDGGESWQKSNPPHKAGDCLTVTFLDGRRGWADGTDLRIFRTLDGGTGWQQLSEPGIPPSRQYSTAYLPTLDFVDDQHGWLIYQDSTASGTPVGELQRTTDGGVTWTWPAQLPAVVDEWNYGPLPPHASITFMDASTGWFIARDAAHDDGQQLYVTHDSGVTWRPQTVPVPSGNSAQALRIGLPSLVNGIMVLPITLADGTVLLDVSADGGTTWKLDPARAPRFTRGAAIQNQGRMAPTFAGNGVIALVLGDQLELNVDNRWLPPFRPQGLEGAIVGIEFADPRVGWVLAYQACPTGGCRFALFKTTDGGHTWRPLGS